MGWKQSNLLIYRYYLVSLNQRVILHIVIEDDTAVISSGASVVQFSSFFSTPNTSLGGWEAPPNLRPCRSQRMQNQERDTSVSFKDGGSLMQNSAFHLYTVSCQLPSVPYLFVCLFSKNNYVLLTHKENIKVVHYSHI